MIRKFNRNDYKNVNGGIKLIREICDSKECGNCGGVHYTLVLDGDSDFNAFSEGLWQKALASNDINLAVQSGQIRKLAEVAHSDGKTPRLEVNFAPDKLDKYINIAKLGGVNLGSPFKL